MPENYDRGDFILRELTAKERLNEDQMRLLIAAEEKKYEGRFDRRDYHYKPRLTPAIAGYLAERGEAEPETVKAILGIRYGLEITKETRAGLEGMLEEKEEDKENDLFLAEFTGSHANAAISRLVKREDVTLGEYLDILCNWELENGGEALEAVRRKILKIDPSKDALEEIIHRTSTFSPAVKAALDLYLEFPLTIKELMQISDRYRDEAFEEYTERITRRAMELAKSTPEEENGNDLFYRRILSEIRIPVEEASATLDGEGVTITKIVNVLKQYPSLAARAGRLILDNPNATAYEYLKVAENSAELEEEAWTRFLGEVITNVQPNLFWIRSALKSKSENIQKRALDFILTLNLSNKDILRAIEEAPQHAESLWPKLEVATLGMRQLAQVAEHAPVLEERVLNILRDKGNLSKDDLAEILIGAKDGSLIQQHFARIYMSQHANAHNLHWLFGIKTGLEEEITEYLKSEKTDFASVKNYCSHNFSGSKNTWLNLCWEKIACDGSREDLFEMLKIKNADTSHAMRCWIKFAELNPTKDELLAIADNGAREVNLRAAKMLCRNHPLSKREALLLAKHEIKSVAQLGWGKLNEEELLASDFISVISPAHRNGVMFIDNSDTPSTKVRAFHAMEEKGLMNEELALTIFLKNCERRRSSDERGLTLTALSYLVRNSTEAASVIRALEKLTESFSDEFVYVNSQWREEELRNNQKLVCAALAIVDQYQTDEEGLKAELESIKQALREKVFLTANGIADAVRRVIRNML